MSSKSQQGQCQGHGPKFTKWVYGGCQREDGVDLMEVKGFGEELEE